MLACVLTGCGSLPGNARERHEASAPTHAIEPSATSSTTRSLAAAPALVTGSGMVLGLKGSFTLCTGMITASLPPAGCGGPPLDLGAVAPASLPGYATYPGSTTVTTAPVGIVGRWDGKLLHVLKVVSDTAVPHQSRPDYPQLATSCPDPGGAQVPRPSPNASGPVPADAGEAQSSRDALAAADAQPDVSMVWYSDNAYVANAAFTGNIEAHRAALRKIYAGPLCVVQAKYTQAHLRALQAGLLPTMAGATGEPVQVESASVTLDRIDVSVLYATDADVAAMRAATIPELNVTEALTQLAADSPLAKRIS